MVDKKIPTPQEFFSQEKKIPTPDEFFGEKKKEDTTSPSLEDTSTSVGIEEGSVVDSAPSRESMTTEYRSKAQHIRKRLDYLKKNFTEAYADLVPIHEQLEKADTNAIDDIEKQLEFVESKIGASNRIQTAEGIIDNPEWGEYKEKILKDPTRIAIQQLQHDSDKLEKAATGADVSAAGEAISGFPMMGAEIAGGIATAADAISKGKGKDLVKGIGSGVKQYAEGYTMLLDEMKKNKAVVDLMDKYERIENGENVVLTEDDKLLTKAFVENAERHNELDKEIPSAYKVGEAVGQSLGFMGEFVLTGGGLQAAGKQVLKTAAKTGAKKAIGKFGVGTAVKMAQAGIQTAKMPTFYKTAAENVSNGMGTGEAFLKAYWETGAETLSERIFLASPVGNIAGKGAAGFLRKAGINFNLDKGAVGIVKNTLEEAAEEKISEVMTAPKDYDSFKEFWKGFTDKEQNMIMLGSVSLMTGGMGSVALSGNTLAKTTRDMRLKRIEKNVPSDLRAEIDVVLGNSDLTIEQRNDLIKDAINSRLENNELGEEPNKTVASALQYMSFKSQEQASETTDKNAVVKEGELTVGEAEEIGDMQAQMEYLKERDVDLEGLNGEQVEQLYNKEKANEDKDAIQKATGEEEQAVTETAKEAKPPTEKKVAETTEKIEEVDEKSSQIKDKVATKESDESLVGRMITLENIDRPTDSEKQGLKDARNEVKARGISKERVSEIIDLEVQQAKKEKDGRQEVQEQKDDSEKGQRVFKPESEKVEDSKKSDKTSEEKSGEVLDTKPLEKGDGFEYKGHKFKVAEKTDDGRIIVETDFDHLLTLDKNGQKEYMDVQKELRNSDASVRVKESAPPTKKETYTFSDFENEKKGDSRLNERERNEAYVKRIEKDIGRGVEFDAKTMSSYESVNAKIKPSEPTKSEKGIITPKSEKVAKKLSKEQEEEIAKKAGIKPKNLRDVFKAGREIFGLNQVQALAQAIITDRIVGKISKRTGKSKSRVYGDIDYRKGKDAELIDRVLKTNDVKFINDALSKAKGAQMPLTGSRVAVYALTDPNVSTPLHEMAHVYERYMTKTEKDAVLKWTKQKSWNMATSEAFARGFEKYLAEGVAPNKALEGAFKRFKEWLTDIYNGIVGSEIDIELNDEMVRVYNAMLGEGTVKPKKTTPKVKEVEAPKKEYKETFKDVDDLLFQDGVKYQGEDKTARHTQAVNNLIKNFEKQGVKDIDKAVRDYLEERGNPVSKEIIDKTLKEKGYAKETKEVRIEGEEKPTGEEEKGEPVGSVREGDGTKATQEEKVSKFGARFFTAVSKVPQAIQDLIKQQGIHLYQPTSLEEATNVADALVEQSSLEDLQKAILDKNMNEAVWLLTGVKTMQRLDKEIYKAKKNGQERQDLVDMQLSIANAMTKKVSGAGLLLRASQVDGVTDYIAPEAWVKDYVDGVIKQRTEGEKTKWFNRSKKLFEKKIRRTVAKTVEDTMDDKTVKKAIEKAKKAKPKPKKQKSAATKKRESLLKEWQKSIDKRKGGIKYQAAKAEFEWTEEDIDFAKQIVQTYIEDAIYNKAVIADKLRKQFDKMGITISDEVMEQIIPTEHNGETLDDLLEKQQLDKAAERLAGRIFGEVVDKKKKDDPLGVMVNTLLGKFREREKAPVKEKQSDLEKIVQAIRNFTEYEDVWKAARDTAIEKVEEMDIDYATKEEYKNKINAAYDNATKFTFTENQVRNSVRKAIKDLNIDLNDVVRSHISVRGATMKSIKDYLVDMSGLDEVEAGILAEAIDKVYRGMLTKRSKSLIAQETKRMKDKSEGKTDSKLQQTEADRLIDLILLKAFEEQDFVDAYASVKGIPKINADHVREIERLAELVRVAPSAAVKRMRKDDLLKYVRRIDGVPLLELLDTLWFGFVLSGVATQIRNTYGAFGNIYGMLATDAIANPAMIPTILRAHKTGRKLGVKKAGVIYRTGKQFFEDRLDLPPASEMATNKAWLFKGIAYLMRHMSANDQIALSIGKESVARMMAEEQMNVNQFKKLYSKKYRDTINEAVDEMLAISPQQLAEFDRIVKEEAEEFDYDKNEQEARRQELIDEARPIDLTKEAETAAARATGNTKAYGTLGFLIHKIAEGMRGITVPVIIKGKTYQVHPLKLAAVFTKISTNVATFQLSFTPVGFINALVGQYGLVKKDSPYYREMTPRERRKAVVRAAVGTGIMAVTYAMMDVGDDDHWLQVTANGTGNYSDDEELRKDGWRPYSIIINGKPIPYRYSPFALLFAPLGYMSDHKKYVKEDKDRSDASLIAEASAGTLTYMAENTPLKGMMSALTSLLGSAATGASNQGEKVLKVFTNMAKGFYSPAIAKNVIDTYDYVMRNNTPENNKLYNDYIDRTFFEILPIPEDNFPAVDVWGMPREQKHPLDEFWATGGKDSFADLRSFHYKQGAGTVGMPSRKTQFFEVYFSDGTMQPTHLDRSHRKFRYAWNQVFLKRRGELLRSAVINLKTAGLRGADYVMAFEEQKRIATDVAKAEVTNYFAMSPMSSKYKE